MSVLQDRNLRYHEGQERPPGGGDPKLTCAGDSAGDRQGSRVGQVWDEAPERAGPCSEGPQMLVHGPWRGV